MRRRDEKPIAPWITTGQWISLEIQRHILETETPGKFGTYGDRNAA